MRGRGADRAAKAIGYGKGGVQEDGGAEGGDGRRIGLVTEGKGKH